MHALRSLRVIPSITLLLGLLIGCQAVTDKQIADVDTPIASPNDNRDYRTLVLENGLKVLLVSDPEADKAAASMNVSVGSAQDPDFMPGLAHFLEHMLFLGTDLYPQANDYQQYISRHGGNHNAFTASQDTNYFFDVEPDALPGALDRFSRFFVAPRFNPEYIERERNAVHSEYQARLRDDGRRLSEAMNQAFNPEHPFTKFSVGSLETLRDNDQRTLRRSLIEFYQAHYDANVMHLAIIAPQSLDTLETWISDRFTEIPDRGLARPTIDAPLLTERQLPAHLEVKRLDNRPQVQFLFPIDDPINDFRHKPQAYLANLLGHEGQGSLLATLRQAGWADGLSAGSTRGDGNSALFAVNISLTPEGIKQLDRIQASLFRMIEIIGKQGIEAWRYDEQARLGDQEFRFLQRGEPIHKVSELAMNLAYYPLEDVHYGQYRMDGLKASDVRRLLDNLTPERLLRVYSDPEVKAEQRTRWFDTPYRLDHIGQWTRAMPLPDLALPEPNPYIAEDLELLTLAASDPKVVVDSQHYQLWYRPDSDFGSPRVEWRFSLQNPESSSDAHHAALTQLLAGWLNDSLNETLYPAHLAGQEFSAYAHGRGMTLAFSGWRDRQERVMSGVLEQLKQGDITADAFARAKLRLVRKWSNAPQNPLYRQMQSTLNTALIRPSWSDTALLEAAEPLGVGALREFRKHFLSQLFIESMVVGNLPQELARREGLLVANALSPRLDKETIPRLEILDVADNAPTLHPHSTRNDNAVLRYLQGPDRSMTSQASLAVLGRMIDTPFYSQLRTEEQLGYVVNASYQPLLDTPGLSLLVQSPGAGPEHIQARMDAFLNDFDERIATLDEAALAPYRDAVSDRLLERDPSLGRLTSRLWYELAYDDTHFNRRERLAEQVRTLNVGTIQRAWQALREAPVQAVTFSAGDAPSDVEALTDDYDTLP